MGNNQTAKTYVEQQEEDTINRMVLVWINQCPEIPVEAGNLEFESLPAEGTGIALASVQGAYIQERYLLGGHSAEYPFKVIYRVKPGNSLDKRLRADEALNRIGRWAAGNLPDMGDLRPVKTEITGQAELFARYESGYEDHQILLKLTYEVTQ